MIKYKFKNDPATPSQANVKVNRWLAPFSQKHIHDFYEIVVVLNNSITNVIDNHSKTMYKNDVCLVCPNNVHHIVKHSESPAYYNVLIKKEYFEKLSYLFYPNFLSDICKIHYITLSYQTFDNVVNLINRGFNLSQTEMKKYHLYQLAVIELLTSFANAHVVSQSSHLNNSNLINRALALMSDPKYTLFSIKEITQTLNVSHEHLTRTFKKAGMNSPHSVFISYKLDYAYTLLKTTDLKIINIAEKIGFYSLHYFNRIFKEHYHITPSECRKNSNAFFKQ